MYFRCFSTATADMSSYSLLSAVLRNFPHGTLVPQREVDRSHVAGYSALTLMDRVMRFPKRVGMEPLKERLFLTLAGIAFPFHVHSSVPINSASPHLWKAQLKAAEYE